MYANCSVMDWLPESMCMYFKRKPVNQKVCSISSYLATKRFHPNSKYFFVNSIPLRINFLYHWPHLCYLADTYINNLNLIFNTGTMNYIKINFTWPIDLWLDTNSIYYNYLYRKFIWCINLISLLLQRIKKNLPTAYEYI